MSEIETAPTGAPAATVATEQVAPVQSQQEVQGSAPETDVEKEERTRDEKGRFQSRLNEITKARREAERERDFYRQQAETFQRQVQQPPQQQPRNDMPTPEEFGYDLTQWGQAVTERLRTEAMQTADERFRQQTMQQQQSQVFSQFEAREQAYAQSNPEYFERVEQLTSVVNFNPVVGEILATSEQGPALVDYLAQHLYEADQLARMPPHLAAVQLGRIEAQLAQAKPKQITGAPAPAPTLGGGSVANKPPERQTDAEWYESQRRSNKR